MRLISWLLSASVCLVYPVTAQAHAHLTRSAPAEGARVESLHELRLWFSERPELSMTFAQLTDSTGRQFPLGAASRESGALGIRYAVLEALPAGRYTLAWGTAGADGHPSRGKIRFSLIAVQPVAVPSGQPHEAERAIPAPARSYEVEKPDAAGSPVDSLARAAMLTALVALLGTVAFALLVVRRAPISVSASDSMMHRAALLGLSASALLLFVAFVRLRLEMNMVAAMAEMPGMHHPSARELLIQTRWGYAWLAQVVSATTSLIALFVASRGVTGAWYVAAFSAVCAAITPALGGHAAAAAVAAPPVLAVAADWVHVLGAGIWLGMLLSLTTIGIPVAITHERDRKWQSVSDLVRMFSRNALFAVTAVLATGIISAWIHLSRVSDLWQTRYGVILLVKLGLVGVTLCIGGYNFLSVQPQLGAETSTLRLRKSATLELITGFIILLATGFLTGVSP